MKKHVILPLLMIAFPIFVQAQNNEVSPENSVKLFFEAFHDQDTTAMRSLTYGEISLQSIGKDKMGTAQISSESFDDFLKSMATIPKTVVFQEKIDSYETKIDDSLAHVWTPYSFFLNGKLSHCGVNSFQLFKFEGDWKIISILDTRRRNCGD
ncbi:MAG TPA: nuclear transport factor 2 family protein [Flavobacteriaceae bacterium]|nr:nuclear transport factor 2 family protein [Flavobacteriaceae bacterium]